MSYKEHINIEETLKIHIRNKDTGEVKTIIVKRPWRKLNLFEKILYKVGILKMPGTITSMGLTYAVKLFCGISGGYNINRIGAYNYDTSTWSWKTATCTYYMTGIAHVDNESSTWGDGNWTILGCKNSADIDANRHNEIDININISGSSLEWWAQIEFTFS